MIKKAWIEWFFLHLNIFEYWWQLNFPTFCDLIVFCFYWQIGSYAVLIGFRWYFYVRIMLHHLDISLLHEYGFSKVKSSYIKTAYYSVFNGYSVNPNKTWINRDWFHTKKSSLWWFWKSYRKVFTRQVYAMIIS